jgi:hypothetical protein
MKAGKSANYMTQINKRVLFSHFIKLKLEQSQSANTYKACCQLVLNN